MHEAVMDYRAKLEAAEARCASLERERDEARREVARLQRVNEIQTRALRILCADHRDKVREGRCVECDREQAEADLDACRGAREITEAALTHAHALINAVVVALGGSVSDYEQSWSALRHIRVMREQRDSLAADRDRLAAALTGLRADLIARRDAGVAHFEMEPEADYSAGFAHCADGILAELDRLTADGPEGGKP